MFREKLACRERLEKLFTKLISTRPCIEQSWEEQDPAGEALTLTTVPHGWTCETQFQNTQGKSQIGCSWFSGSTTRHNPPRQPYVTEVIKHVSSSTDQFNELDVEEFRHPSSLLQGKTQEGRAVGIEPVEELKSALNLKNGQVCKLEKSAYGIIDAA